MNVDGVAGRGDCSGICYPAAGAAAEGRDVRELNAERSGQDRAGVGDATAEGSHFVGENAGDIRRKQTAVGNAAGKGRKAGKRKAAARGGDEGDDILDTARKDRTVGDMYASALMEGTAVNDAAGECRDGS